MLISTLTPELAWFIGLYEGEGCCLVTNKRYTIQMTISMVDEDVIRRIAEVVGFGNVYGPYDNGPDRQPYWRWQVTKRDQVVPLVESMLDHVSKRRKNQLEACLSNVKPLKQRPYGIGVRPAPTAGKWVAYVWVGRNKKHLGTFSSPQEAIDARSDWETSQSKA